MTSPVHDPPAFAAGVDALVHRFETLTPASARDLSDLYTVDASFKDPFNDVQGRAAVERIFNHLFEQVHEPRFEVVGRVVDAPSVVIVWNLWHRGRRSAPPSSPDRIHGVSLLSLAPDGRIAHHRDYWDTGEELWSKLPWIGALMRRATRTLAAPQDRSPPP